MSGRSKSKPSSSSSSSRLPTIVLDLGGYSAKVGLSSDESPRILPNCVYKAKSEKKRQFVSAQVNECKDQHQLFHLNPFSGGYLTNWELQERIFSYFLSDDVLHLDASQSNLVMTEPYFNLQNIKKLTSEAIFEDVGFASASFCPPAFLSSLLFRNDYPEETSCCVIDSGHSFTHIIPVINGEIVWDNVVRIPIGGKILTNYLKQRISFQQLDVMDETNVINQLKEDMCYISTNLQDEFAECARSPENLTRAFVMPDYADIFKGFMKPQEETFSRPGENEQVIRLSADRFVTPEILFHPSIIAESRMGVAEAAAHVIKSFPVDQQYHLFRNVILSGGCCQFPGFGERFAKELGTALPEYGEVSVTHLRNPVTNAWFGGKLLAENSELYSRMSVTKAEYEEHGENICEKRFIRNTNKSRSS